MRLSNEVDMLLGKILMKLTLLDDGGRSIRAVVVSHDVLDYILKNGDFAVKCDPDHGWTIAGCEVKIVKGIGVLFVGYDMSDNVTVCFVEDGEQS